MKIYLVGGAVRDELLGRQVKDKDYVVVGGTPEDLISKGFYNVGKHFPVFIDPQTKDEYALARKERKVSKGHDGFEFEFGPEITLEEDLLRRDFTINAMAKDDEKIIDPCKGREDLGKKILRHVSEHFIEDPLRVIRGFRFASYLNFNIADETKALMKEMVASGELNTLSSERVWGELKNVLKYGNPKIFFELCEEFELVDFVFPGLSVTQVCWERLTGEDPESLFSLVHFFTSDREAYFERYIVPKNLKKEALLLKDSAQGLRTQYDKSSENLLRFFKRIRMEEKVLLRLIKQTEVLYPDFSYKQFFLDILEGLVMLDLSQFSSPDKIQEQQLNLIKSYL